MRHFRTVGLLFLLAALLIFFPDAARRGTADPYPQNVPGWFRQLDKDKDGQVSLAEWVRAGRKRDEFQLYDLNGDGFITADEVLRYLRRQLTKQEKENAKAVVNLPKGLPAWFRQLDRDHDGQVSLAEWLRAGRTVEDFRRYDLDGDGFITAREVLRTLKRVHPLPFDGAPLQYQGTIEEATDERYLGRGTFKIFTVRLEEGRTYQIEEASPVFYAYLILEDPNGNVVAQNNSGGVGLTSRIVHEAAETGIYRIIATSQDGVRTGDFTLWIRTVHSLDDTPPKEPPPKPPDPSDKLPKGLPSWFKELDENQDGQVSLAEWLQAGGKRDEFRLYDLNGDGFLTPDEILRVVKKADRLEWVKGRVDHQGRVVESAEERYDDKKSFKILTIKLEAGKNYQIEAVSQAFYAYLYLEDPNGDIVAEHNSGGFGATARIVHEAEETGMYRIIVTSLAGVRTGDFTLTVWTVRDGWGGPSPSLPAWFKALDEDEDGQVSLAEWLQAGRKRDEFARYDLNGDGFITADEVLRAAKKADQLTFDGGRIDYKGAIEEPTDERYQGKKAFKIFTVRLTAGQTYRIEEVSQIFYAYLYLEDPDGKVVAEHNSGGVGLTARLVYEAAESGTYRLIATSQDGVRTGDFALTIRAVRESEGDVPQQQDKGLPPWFRQLDKDHDGQVSIQEWLKGGRKLDEFQLYDSNGDGFITPDEVLRYLRSHPKKQQQ